MVKKRNSGIADELREMANILEQQAANSFRVQAYRHAADTVDSYPIDVASVLEREGIEGLVAIPTVGRGIASAIQEIITTGRWSALERLRGTLEPEQLFQVVPGIGPNLARRIHDQLHIDSLEALEIAAHDGRLRHVEGLGERRIAAIVPALGAMLGRRRPQAIELPSSVIPVSVLLELDTTYRRKAAANSLPVVTPKRFNPEAKPWLPIMHTTREDLHFTVMFSNTALAHKLKRNFDWVVIYYYENDHREGSHTVVTETRGELTGQRVVRGRENECREHYAGAAQLEFSSA